jgi:nicotinate-nucleotide adenylyltransferase
MTDRTTLGLLGGTFDPIHLGHLDAAEAARTALGLDRMRLIPSGAPPHRPVVANRIHRLAMARLAVEARLGYEVSEAETGRLGPSYTADTLRVLHAEGWKATQLFFVLGLDAFAEIAMWREFPAVLDDSHLVVITRSGTTPNQAIERLPVIKARLRRPGTPLDQTPGTVIIPVEAQTRNISSSGIRDRLARRQAIDHLVPPPVARYILDHRLYDAVGPLHDQNRDT